MNGIETDQRSSLLDQLRIDRDEDAEARGPFRFWVTAVAVLAIGVALAAWFLLTIPPTVLVDVATAELVSHETDLGRGSALDGSGYVVARRQAPDTSNITGKVMEVMI
jgi:hypothetical protein